MIHAVQQLVACHWSGRRIQRYLDADPAAPLRPEEVARIEAHLAVCARCARTAHEQRALHRALSRWSGSPSPDPESLARLRAFLGRLQDEDAR